MMTSMQPCFGSILFFKILFIDFREGREGGREGGKAGEGEKEHGFVVSFINAFID